MSVPMILAASEALAQQWEDGGVIALKLLSIMVLVFLGSGSSWRPSLRW